jgi:hypothetical protein
MTFDLHYKNETKSEAFKIWVKRIYLVASTLNLSYKELWELPEQEFLVLEEISDEVIKKKKENQEKLLEANRR